MASRQVIRGILRSSPLTAIAATLLLAGCGGSDDNSVGTHTEAMNQQAETRTTPSSAATRMPATPPPAESVLPPEPPPAPLPTPSTSNATLSWLAPTVNSNGSALTDLIGYKIYYGTDPTALSSSVTLETPALNTYVIDELRVGATYYFAVAALASDGTESVLSAIVSKAIL
jgi:hypothetical protein